MRAERAWALAHEPEPARGIPAGDGARFRVRRAGPRTPPQAGEGPPDLASELELSAPRLRASVVCQAEGHLLVVRLRDPATGLEALYPPGGGVEPGESPEETARRETLEETGLRVRVEPAVKVMERYPFRWGGVDYDVTTHYFAATLEGAFEPPRRVVDAPYNLGASWVPVAEALVAMAIHPAIASACARVVRLAKHAT